MAPVKGLPEEDIQRITTRGCQPFAPFMIKMFRPGLIDRGRTGELWWRIISIIAKDDLCRSQNEVKLSPRENFHFRYAYHFSFIGFIESLFLESATILDTPAEISNQNAYGEESHGQRPTVRSLLEHAVCNFNHYVATQKPLRPNTIGELLHQLFCFQAAFQLAPCQPFWDAMILVYNGAANEPFDPSKIAVFLVQTKNQNRKPELSVDKYKTSYEELFGNRLILYPRRSGYGQGEVCNSAKLHDSGLGLPSHGPQQTNVSLLAKVLGRRFREFTAEWFG